MPVWLVFVTLAALGVRLAGIDFGLPFLYHPDEAEIVDRALAMRERGPNPGWFAYPTLYLYAQAALHTVIGRTDVSAVYLAGRALTALFGAGAVVFVALAPRRRGDLLAASAAGLLLALFPLHVEHSHYVTTDVPVSFFSALLAWQAAGLAGAGASARVRDYALAGVTVGLAASTKYPGALLGVLVAAVYALAVLPSTGVRAALRDARLPAAAGASVVAFVAGSPFVLLDWRGFARDFAVEAAHMRSGHLGFEDAGNGWLVMLGHAYDSSGPLALALVLFGAVFSLVRRDAFAGAVAIASAILFAIAGSSRVLFARYLLIAVPLWCILGGYGVVLARELVGRVAPRRATAISLVVLAAALAAPAVATYHRTRLFLSEDTRTVAWRWVGGLEGSGERPIVAVERYAFPVMSASLASAEIVPLEYDLAAMRARGIRYVVISDRLAKRYTRAPGRHPRESAFYAELESSAKRVAVFSPFDAEDGEGGARVLAGPTVVVYGVR